MKHYIITRFASWIGETMTKEKLFSDGFLKNSFNKFKNALLPTLENQTNKNFTLIVNIHDDIPVEKIPFLYQLNTTFDIKILRTREISQFILQNTDDNGCVILSRIDIDDFIRKDVVNLIQEYADTVKDDYIGLGLYDGSTLWYSDKTTYVHPAKGYTKNNAGAMSVMCTVIFNNHKIKHWLKEYKDEGPVCYNHTKMFDFIKDFINKHDKNAKYSNVFIKEKDKDKPLYLFAGYGDNGSIMYKKSQNAFNSWNTSGIISNISFDEYGL